MRYVSGGPLDGVVLRQIVRSEDDRGSFMEIFKKRWPGPLEPVQWALVHSRPNVLRGLHLHLGHDEYFMLLYGSVFVGLRDLRLDSPTRDHSCLIELTADKPTAIMFPRGFIHGWYFPMESMHLQAVSQAYEDYHPYDNLGCHWSDPEVDIPWPCTDPILSERAQQFPTLRELCSRLYANAR